MQRRFTADPTVAVAIVAVCLDLAQKASKPSHRPCMNPRGSRRLQWRYDVRNEAPKALPDTDSHESRHWCDMAGSGVESAPCLGSKSTPVISRFNGVWYMFSWLIGCSFLRSHRRYHHRPLA